MHLSGPQKTEEVDADDGQELVSCNGRGTDGLVNVTYCGQKQNEIL